MGIPVLVDILNFQQLHLTIYGKTIGKTLLKYPHIPFFVSSFIRQFAKEFKVSYYLYNKINQQKNTAYENG